MRAALLLLPLLAGGCYLTRQAAGQVNVLLSSRSLDAMLADPSVPAAVRKKLRLVLEIKDFGERRMGLASSSNYTSYYDTGGEPITWLVSACRKDRFEPVTWWFPIVGTVPYKGFFSRADADAEARALEAQGYDVEVGRAAAYSTLGYFSDPVLSTMMDLPEERLAALILHELTHGTVYAAGRTDFNEALASFTGCQGAMEFARFRYGTDSVPYARAVRACAAAERRDAAARELLEKLGAFYASDLPPERKIELRDLVAGRPVNNARLLMQRRYGRTEEFQALFERAGGDWREFFARVSAGINPDAVSAGSAPSPP